VCSAGRCVACTPNCSGAACGDDGCGGSCGTCGGTTVCVGHQCQDPAACLGTTCLGARMCCAGAPLCVNYDPGLGVAGTYCGTRCGVNNSYCRADGDCCSGYTCVIFTNDGAPKGTCTDCQGHACTVGQAGGGCCSTEPYCHGQDGCRAMCADYDVSCGADSDCCSGMTCSNMHIGRPWYQVCGGLGADCLGKSCAGGCCTAAPYCQVTAGSFGYATACQATCLAASGACLRDQDCCPGLHCPLTSSGYGTCG
jgi:hypothetical protein